MAPNASARSCGQVRAPLFVLPAVAAMVSSTVQSIRQGATVPRLQYPRGRSGTGVTRPGGASHTGGIASPTGRRSDPHQSFVGRCPGGSPPRCTRRVVYPGRGTCDLPVVGGRAATVGSSPGQAGRERPVLTPCATGDHGVRTVLLPAQRRVARARRTTKGPIASRSTGAEPKHSRASRGSSTIGRPAVLRLVLTTT